MNTKVISPKKHAIVDYVLVASLLAFPSILGMNKKAKMIYTAEALMLLPYVALTKQPLALKGLIPLQMHKKIDSFNVAQFAIQNLFKPFRKSKKEMIFNIAFTAIAGLNIVLTDWKRGS